MLPLHFIFPGGFLPLGSQRVILAFPTVFGRAPPRRRFRPPPAPGVNSGGTREGWRVEPFLPLPQPTLELCLPRPSGCELNSTCGESRHLANGIRPKPCGFGGPRVP